MKLNYSDLLSGDDIWISKIGHVRSPKLQSLKPKETGMVLYGTYLNILFSDNKDIFNLLELMGISDIFNNMSDLEKIETPYFNLLIKSEITRELLKDALSFFIVEDVVFSQKYLGYLVKCEIDGILSDIGFINQENFDEVVGIIKQLIHKDDNNIKNLKFSSETAKKWWMEVQKRESKQLNYNNTNYELSNIISKLSVVGIGYTIFNIWDLTLFQLYDQFYAYFHDRISNLNENIFANNGGDNFDAEAWLKNNNKN